MSVINENYDRKCKNTQGKIRRAYLFHFVKHKRTLIKDVEMTLTQFPETIIYDFEVEGTYNQNSSVEDGCFFVEQNVTIKLNTVYDVLDIHKFLFKDYRVIVENYNNELLIFGLRNGLTASITNQSGSNKSEFNGFEIAFAGKEEKTALLINDLEALGFSVYIENNLLNYDLNFNLS